MADSRCWKTKDSSFFNSWNQTSPSLSSQGQGPAPTSNPGRLSRTLWVSTFLYLLTKDKEVSRCGRDTPSTGLQLVFWKVNLHRSVPYAIPLMALWTTCGFLSTCVLSPSSTGIWPHRHMTHNSGFLVYLWDLKECQLHYKRTSLLNIIIEMSFHYAISMEGKIIFIHFFMIIKVIKFIGRQLKTQKCMKKKINIAHKFAIHSLTLTELSPSQCLVCSGLQRWRELAEPLFLCCLHADGEADKRWLN